MLMPMPSTALESARMQPADLCTCHDNNNNNNNINYLTTILLQQLQQHASRGHMSPVGLPKRHPPKRSSLRSSPILSPCNRVGRTVVFVVVFLVVLLSALPSYRMTNSTAQHSPMRAGSSPDYLGSASSIGK